MANRIKGITVEIGGDTTKLQTALKGVNGQIKNTQTALKDVEKLLKLDPHNTELLSQKQKLLTQAIGETKEKLATLKTAAEQANEQLQKGEITQEQYDALQSSTSSQVCGKASKIRFKPPLCLLQQFWKQPLISSPFHLDSYGRTVKKSLLQSGMLSKKKYPVQSTRYLQLSAP